MQAPRVSLEQWRAFHAVVDYGGFAQAAKQLHRSQSAISYTVAKLQQQLGIPLLIIEGRKASLTETGKVLLRHSRYLLRQAIELEQFADSLEQGWEASIHIVVDNMFPSEIIMRALQQFKPLSHGCEVNLTETMLAGAEDAMLKNKADIVITGSVPNDMLGEQILEIEFVAVSNAGHPLQSLQRNITKADLERELQVVISDSGNRKRLDAGWLGAEHRWTVSSLETSITAVSNGLGFAWLPAHRIQTLLDKNILKPLLLTEGARFNVNLFLIRNQNPGPGIRLFSEILQKTIAEKNLANNKII
ncbi:MAG: LysR family transcriptional regulator [Thiohalomonadales bacterium]